MAKVEVRAWADATGYCISSKKEFLRFDLDEKKEFEERLTQMKKELQNG